MRTPQTETPFGHTAFSEKRPRSIGYTMTKKKKERKKMWSMLVWRSNATVHLSNSCCAHYFRRFCSRASRSASASSWAAWASPFFAPGAAKAPPATGRAASARTKLLQTYRRTQKKRTSGSREGFPYSTVRRTWWGPARPEPGTRWRRCTWDGDKRLNEAHFVGQVCQSGVMETDQVWLYTSNGALTA